jgi:PilZ domain-containing protein
MLRNINNSNSAQPAPNERRRNPRYPFTASIEAIETKSGTRLNGRIGDLGLGGCYVDTLSPFPVGNVLSIKISKDNESFQAKAKVTYSLVGMGMGLAFIAADPEQVKVFQRWIRELSGEKSPASAASSESPANSPAASSSAGNTPAASEPQFVLTELIIALMRKGVLDKDDGNAMLRKLNR